MHEKKKLEEAKYFFSRMVEVRDEVNSFIYNLSAFLSASRSVLQYALKESEIKQSGIAWYSANISNSPILGFFRDKRDLSIHEEPVRPQVIHKVMINETIRVSDSISIVIKDRNGNVKGEYTSPEDPKVIPEDQNSSVVSETEYKFNDWSGNEDGITLCRLYLEQLDNLVKDGIKKGLISG